MPSSLHPQTPAASAPVDTGHAHTCDDENRAQKEAHKADGQAQATDQRLCGVWWRGKHLGLWERKQGSEGTGRDLE